LFVFGLFRINLGFAMLSIRQSEEIVGDENG